MRTPTAPAGRPGEDRLDRLLRTGGTAGAGDAAGRAGGGADVEADVDADAVADAVAGGGPDDGPARGRHRHAEVPLLSVPSSLRSSELGVGVRAVRGLLVLAVVAVLVLGGRWLWTQREAVATPADQVGVGRAGPVTAGDGAGEEVVAGGEEATSPEGASAVGLDAGPEGSSAGAAATRTGPPTLVVHVTGAVADPGVVEVPAGSRVVDALRAAGGATQDADESTLNLARLLVDGERVWLGRPGETPPVAAGPAPGAGVPDGAAGQGGAGAPAAPLDLNAATQADLEELPGIGPVTAGHILAWREEHGRFSSVDELLEVSGIGERTLAQLEPLVTVGG